MSSSNSDSISLFKTHFRELRDHKRESNNHTLDKSPEAERIKQNNLHAHQKQLPKKEQYGKDLIHNLRNTNDVCN